MHDFNLTPEEAKTLAWIHSNKFITTKLFHKKFVPENNFKTACNHLDRLAKEKGLLKRVSAHQNADSFYFCTRGTIHRLRDMGLVLTAPQIRAPHESTFNKEHDKRVLEIRILFENDSQIKNLIWLSDYEMQIGYKMEWKKTLMAGKGSELKNVRLYKDEEKVPDGHFEANLKGKDWEFILEYEHSEYGKEKLNRVVRRIFKSYSKPIKLIVTKKASRTRVLMGKISQKIKDPQERAAWWFSDYEKVTSLPFLNVPWVDLDDFHPALIEPKET